MNDIATVDSMSLTAIADEINAIYSNVENEHMRTAMLYAEARRKFGDDNRTNNAKFIKWADKKTPYKANTIYGYLSVEEKFYARKKTIDKSIPFNTLRDLSSSKVDKKTVTAVLKKFENKKKPTTAQVKEIIKNAAPPKPKPTAKFNPDFAVRSERRGTVVASHRYLLDVDKDASAETVRILAKHWKHKYHPDKGGDPEIFNRISKAETELLKARGVV